MYGGKKGIFRFSLPAFALAILMCGCAANDFCRDTDDLGHIPGIRSLEIINSSNVRVITEHGAPVLFLDSKGAPIESNILGLGDIILISDEHYGGEFKIIEIGRETVSFEVHENWSYPVPGKCNSGKNIGTSHLRPYDSRSKK